MAVQNKQQQLEKAAEFFQQTNDSAVMSAQFSDKLERELSQKYITYYESPMKDSQPFWQKAPFLGAVAFAAVASIFVITATYLQSNKILDVSPNTNPDDTRIALGAELAYMEGEVEYQRGENGWMNADSGMDLNEGDMIRTFADSRAIINLDDGSAIRLNYDSEVALTNLAPDNMQITNVEGEVYARVARLERDFAIVTPEVNYVSLGTAYTTINTDVVKGVKVFQSSVKVEDKSEATEVIVDEGKAYFKGDAKVVDLTIKEIKKDEFALWNKDKDEQNTEYKDKLGKLADLTAPSIKITSTFAGKTVSKAKVTLKGITEAGAIIKVKGKMVENNDGNFEKQLTLSEGLNKISMSVTDAAGNKSSKVIKVTYKNQVADTNTGGGAGGGEGTIVITSVQTQSNGVKVFWSVNGLSTPEGFKVVYGTGSNPSYPGNNPVYFGDAGARSGFVNIGSGGTYHFRVCRYVGGSCDNYSNDVTGTVAAANPITSVNASFDSGNSKLTWTTAGGPGQGFKVAFSAANPTPSYTGANDSVVYTSNTYHGVSQNGYYRICAWNGSNGCTAESVVIHVTSF